MAYLEFEIPVRSWTQTDREILQARMAMIGFEGFTEGESLIQAYIREEDFQGDHFSLLVEEMSASGLNLQYRFHTTPDQNWNEEWEKKFDPVIVKEKVLIRAPFHASDNDLPMTLVIEPKMSFGTGHHITTRLMIEAMLEIRLDEMQVLDMGTGTGVLGIFAAMSGASRVLGIDNDQWAYENALENVVRNQINAMEVRLGDAGSIGNECFDVVLANITRNILVRDLPEYEKHLNPGGTMLISGILAEDVLYVLNVAYELGLEHLNTREEENWMSLCFVKQS